MAFIGLGSNLHGPENQIRSALTRLKAVPLSRLEDCSSLYRNPPIGPQGQPDYVNAVARLLTELQPRSLLDELQTIEQAQGRVRDGIRWGPRRIDLDLLIYGDEIIDEPGLHIPHSGIQSRAFVLLPMSELNPNIYIPELGTVRELLSCVDTSDVIPITTPIEVGRL